MINKSTYKLSLFLGLVLWLFACEEPLEPIPTCKDFPFIDPPFGLQYETNGAQSMAPDFNPNNPNEFAFVWLDSTNNKRFLSIANLHNRTIKKLHHTYIIGKPEWGEQNWIIFTELDGQLYKIKPTGDSLTQLTFTGGNFYPSWGSNGQQVLFRKEDQTPFPNLTIIDNKGNVFSELDSMVGSYIWHSWSPDGKKIALSKVKDLAYFHLDSLSQTSFEDVATREYGIARIGWSKDSQKMYWTSYKQFGWTDIDTKQSFVLRQGCDEVFYLNFSLSPDNKQVLMERIDRQQFNSGIVREQHDLYLINLEDNSEEKIVFVP